MKKKRLFSVNVWTSLVFMAVGAALLSFGGMLQAQTQTYYTEFDFTGNVIRAADGYTAQITTTGGVTGTIQVALTNREKFGISGHFDVVDAVEIEGGVWACQDRSTDEDVFGHHFTRPADFMLASGASNTYTFSYNFPRYYSGNYMGCILYYETDAERDVETTSRKALLVSANLTSAEIGYLVKVYPVDRSITNAFGYADSGYIRIYRVDDGVGTEVISGGVMTNINGTGIVNLIIEPGYYNIVYRSLSSLASYISGFYVDGQSQEFDFTTGSSLYGTETKTAVEDDGFRYQIGGELPVFLENGHGVIQWKYDGADDSTDLAVYLGLLTPGSDTYCTYPCNTSAGTTITIGTTQYTIGDTPFVFDLDGSAAVNISDSNTILRSLPQVLDIYQGGNPKDISVGADWMSVTF